MFLIRQITDPAHAANRKVLAEAQTILREQFPALSANEIECLPDSLARPFKHGFHPLFFVAEDDRRGLRGFALLKEDANLGFAYLEYIASARGGTGGGIGAALYQRVRETALEHELVGIFMECLPDDPELSPDPGIRDQNAARLKFYERFGARPIANNDYATPVRPGDTNPPYLVFDPLGARRLPGRDVVGKIVRAILERKYGDYCPPGYIDRVVESFSDDPVRLRPPLYVTRSRAARPGSGRDGRIALIVNDRHDIHHIRERGYVQAPVRIRSILRELGKTGLFTRLDARRYSESHITSVHDPALVAYLKRACATVPEGRSVYPYVFPIRNQARPPRELPLRAGYYCIDTFTPIHRNAWPAARGAVDCALTGAAEILQGRRFAYALVRPPGHHAERKAFGGFCYLNSCSIAAHYMSRYGNVAVLDVDYHHGNGTQDIFYDRSDVFTLSIHGHPRHTYPYFAGFEDETGEGGGDGFNRNFPLKEGLDGAAYRKVLERALRQLKRFGPDYLVLALGLDTAKADPTGSFGLLARDFEANGRMIAELELPTLIVQEGGYRTRTLGINARHFFQGLTAGQP